MSGDEAAASATLRRHGLTPDAHVVLSEHGVRKRRHTDPDDRDVHRLLPLAHGH